MSNKSPIKLNIAFYSFHNLPQESGSEVHPGASQEAALPVGWGRGGVRGLLRPCWPGLRPPLLPVMRLDAPINPITQDLRQRGVQFGGDPLQVPPRLRPESQHDPR